MQLSASGIPGWIRAAAPVKTEPGSRYAGRGSTGCDAGWRRIKDCKHHQGLHEMTPWGKAQIELPLCEGLFSLEHLVCAMSDAWRLPKWAFCSH